MADDVRITNLPDSGSPARVAFDLLLFLNRSGVNAPAGQDRRAFVLDLYAECLNATAGHR